MDKEDRDHFRTIGSALHGLPTVSSKPTNGENSKSTQDQAYFLQKAKTIFSCYRKDEVQNPETYLAAVTAVLSEYPIHVVDYVCDPRTGITGNQIWLPSVAEIKTACENQYNRIMRDEERRVRIERQFKERETDLVPTERLKAMGRAWLDRSDVAAQQLTSEKPKAFTDEQKKAALEDAAKAGREISGMKLLPETVDIIRHHDTANKEANGSSKERPAKEYYTDDEIPF